MKSFKEFVVEEGTFMAAIKHGIKVGAKAFKKKLAEPESKVSDFNQKIINAEGEELKSVIKQIVNNGYTFKDGKVVKKSLMKNSTDWLLEHVSTLLKNRSQKNRETRPQRPLRSEK